MLYWTIKIVYYFSELIYVPRYFKVKYLNFLFSFCLFIFSVATQAQVVQNRLLKFDALTIDNGLSQGMVNDMQRDKYGFMWFATKDGLNCYDGYQFTVFKHDIDDSTSIADNFIKVLFEDAEGRLWIGTSSRGLELFNRETETFTHFPSNPDDKNTLSNNVVTDIVQDKNGALWIATLDGLNKLSFDTQNPQKLVAHIQRYFSDAITICADNTGFLWSSTINNGTVRIAPDVNGKDVFTNLDMNEYSWQPTTDTLNEKIVRVFVVDTLHNKLYLIMKYAITCVDLKTLKPDIISKGRIRSALFNKQVVMDTNQIIWYSENGWLLQFDTQKKIFTHVSAIDNAMNFALDNACCVYKDINGIIWIGTRGYGILKYHERIERFNKTDDKSIGFMATTPDDKVIITKSKMMLTVFDPVAKKYTIEVPDSLFNYLNKDNDFGITNSALCDKNGIYWLSKNRLTRFNPIANVVQQYLPDEHFDFPVYLEDDSIVWIGTTYGFNRFNQQTETFTNFPYPVPTAIIPYDFLEAVYKDESGIFWLGTISGLFRFDPINRSWKQYKNDPKNNASLSFDVIFSICADPINPSRFLWIGTNGGGVNRFDKTTGTFIRFTQKDGLPNDVVYGVLSDNKNNIWMSTNKGLSRFNFQTKQFRNFELKDGLQGNEFNRYAFCKTRSGLLFFGGVNGFNYFNPEAIIDNNYDPLVQITSLSISNKKLYIRQNQNILSKPIYMTNNNTLSYSDNMLTIEFSVMDFIAPEKNIYQYKLDGFDKEWIQSGTIHAATYTNLDPGTYTFLVKGCNIDGVWSTNTAKLILKILPPWYMTWWFRLSLIVAILGSFYLMFRFRVNRALEIVKVRNRIARDLHDEVGSNLSSIRIYNEVALTKSQGTDVEPLLAKIADYAQSSMEAMNDIVWMISASNDKFENIISRMSELAIGLFENKNCQLHLSFEDKLNDIKLGMDERKNFYLIYKEALNNIAKYADCHNVWIEMKMLNAVVFLRIKDDGKGFDYHEAKNKEVNVNGGNGLINMHNRAAILKGELTIKSNEGAGTVLVLMFEL